MRGLRSVLLLVLVGCSLAPAAELHAHESSHVFPVGDVVRFEPLDGTVLRLAGHGPYRGVLEVRREGGRVSVVNELTIEQYLYGLREVPGSWPMEALKAQAIAARTYALWEAQRGYWNRFGFDVCATTSCQVYGGALAERGEEGRRWVRAVDETEGQILRHDGDPILARYHASSGGRTLANEAVYPSSGARPYLRAVDDPFDAVSPLHRWTVEFTSAQLQEILRVGIELAGELDRIEADPDARRVTILTKGGELEMSSVRMRRVLSEYAPKVYPELYPGPRPDGRLMPMTMPSSRFTVERTDDGFRFSGIGYGHGVGMSQWGAKGRAEEGADHTEILAAYYGGLRPERVEMPEALRVGIARSVRDAEVFADGPFAVRAGPDTVASSTLGTWGVRPGGSRTLEVAAPEGFDAPLVLSGVRAPGEVVHDPPERGTSLTVRFVLPKSASVTAELRRGDDVVARADAVFDAGAAELELPLRSDRLARSAEYDVVLSAFDGTERDAAQRSVRISRPRSFPWTGSVAALLAVLAAWFVLRRRPPRGASGDDDATSAGLAAVLRKPVRRVDVSGGARR